MSAGTSKSRQKVEHALQTAPEEANPSTDRILTLLKIVKSDVTPKPPRAGKRRLKEESEQTRRFSLRVLLFANFVRVQCPEGVVWGSKTAAEAEHVYDVKIATYRLF
jgi:hypothetical protein